MLVIGSQLFALRLFRPKGARMTTETDICNFALSKLGTRSKIASLDELSVEAEECKLHYTTTRDQILRMAHWGWAKKTGRLVLLKSAPGTPTSQGGAAEWSEAYPPPPWLYTYEYPADCIQVRYIVSEIATGIQGVPLFSTTMMVYPYSVGPAVRFEIGADVNDSDEPITIILTSQYRAIGVYTYRVVDTTLYDALFVEAISAALGAKMVNALSGERSMRKDLFEEANYHIVQARVRDGNEALTILETEAAWIAARSDIAVPAGYWASPYPPLFSTM